MMSFEKLVLKYPAYVRDPSLCYVDTRDNLYLPPPKQLVSNVEILLNYPSTIIKFEKKDTVIALVITTLKISMDTGYEGFNDFECTLNNHTLNSKDFDILENKFMNDIDIDKIAHLIQETDNRMIIKAKFREAYDTSNFTIIGFGKSEDEFPTEADKIWNEWKDWNKNLKTKKKKILTKNWRGEKPNIKN